MNKIECLSGVYTEIRMNDDVILTDRNIDIIKSMIFSHLETLSYGISHLSFSGLFSIKSPVVGCRIKDAINHLKKLITEELNPGIKVVETLERICSKTSSIYCQTDELKRIFCYFILGIKNELITYKIPHNKAVLLNIKDIDNISFRKVPDNVVSIVLDPHIDIAIRDYLGKRKIHYVVAQKPLKINESYEVDLEKNVSLNVKRLLGNSHE